MSHESDLNLKATELRLGLPGTDHERDDVASSSSTNKRASPPDNEAAPPPKAQIVGWPPVRSYRKNNLIKTEPECGIYVKVSMDGAPYLRKIDLKVYSGYKELIMGLGEHVQPHIGEYSEREGYKGSEYAPAYEDKDGDLMLVGDVPWDMFMSTCKRLRITRGPDAKSLNTGSVN